jgi:hypothetical protein
VPLKKTNQLAAFSRPAPLARNEPGGATRAGHAAHWPDTSRSSETRMGTMSDEQLYARLILRQMRAMKATFPKPRHSRLPKEARALKSIVAEARALGLVPPEPPAAPRRRR